MTEPALTPPRPGPAPRPASAPPVRVRPALVVVLVLGWLLAGAGLYIAAQHDSRPWDDLVLDRRGQPALAQVVAVDNVRLYKGRFVDQARLRYETADGRTVEVRADAFAGDDKQRLAAGQVPVEYDPERPERMRVAGESAVDARELTLLGMLAPGLLVLGYLTFLHVPLARRRRARRLALARDGEVALARVEAVKAEPWAWVVRYRFEAGGQTVRGKLERPVETAVGDGLWVFHDPQDPRHHRPAELAP